MELCSDNLIAVLFNKNNSSSEKFKSEAMKPIEYFIIEKKLFEELIACVKYLHDSNIMHRNLRPENVLILKNPNNHRFTWDWVILILNIILYSWSVNPILSSELDEVLGPQKFGEVTNIIQTHLWYLIVLVIIEQWNCSYFDLYEWVYNVWFLFFWRSIYTYKIQAMIISMIDSLVKPKWTSIWEHWLNLC